MSPRFLVYRRVARRDGIRAEFRERKRPAVPAQTRAFRRIREQPIECGRERDCIPWRNEDSRLIGDDGVRQSTGVERDNWRLAEQRLDRSKSQPFGHGWNHMQRGLAVAIRQLSL